MKLQKKIAAHLPENQSVFRIQSSDFSHVFCCDLEQNQTEVKLKEKIHIILSILTTF